MGLIIVKADFIGNYDLVKSANDKIDSFIAKYEKNLLNDLLGSELFELFEADVTSYEPVTDRFLTIFNPIKTKQNGVEIQSDGIKEMLLGLIYFEYERKNRYKTSNSGPVKNITDSANSDIDLSHLYNFYNDAIHTYKSIQYYISVNRTIYPEFNGLNKEFSYIW